MNSLMIPRSPPKRLFKSRMAGVQMKDVDWVTSLSMFLFTILESKTSGLNKKVWHKTFRWGRTHGLISSHLNSIILRSSHNNLYQMVKKRTLEARSKTQSINDPCTMQASPHCSASKVPNVACAQKKEDGKSKICYNTEILRASPFSCSPMRHASTPKKTVYPADDVTRGEFEQCPVKTGNELQEESPCCRPKKETGPCKEIRDPCEPVCESDPKDFCKRGGMDCGPKPPPEPKCPIDWAKLLLAFLAGLGLGGLLYWLLFGGSKKKEKEEEVVCIKSTDLPNHVPYLLIGGGAASFSAFRSIKSENPGAKILMITNEWRKPYMRPPLSKELWYTAQESDIKKDYRFKQWSGSERSLYFEPDEFFVAPTKLMDGAGGGIAVAHGFTVKKVDPKKKVAILTDGYEIGYDKCLIATGCTPKNLHVFKDAPPGVRDRVMVYRTPDDFERLKRYADEKKSIAIIGNGFVGSELACSLAKYGNDKGVRVYQIFQEPGNMSKILPDYLSLWTMKKIQELGVCILPNSKIRSAERDENLLKLHLNTGKTVLTDVAVVCVGCDPNTELATTSGLDVDRTLGGFLVNSELEARPNLFVAGDASCFFDPILGRRRVEHHEHSIVSGRLAGENMAGKKKPYDYQSMFWSDLGPDIGYEAVGLVDSSLQTVGVFATAPPSGRSSDNLDENKAAEAMKNSQENEELKESEGPDIKCEDTDEYGRGVIFYLKNDRIVGILLWNLFNRIGLARTIINQNKQYQDLNEVAKLFEIQA